MSGLTNGYLTDIGKVIIGKSFLGSFPCDMQPKIKRRNFSVIFNLSKHTEKGTHFIAIFGDNKRLLYFDPLGNKCNNIDILTFIKKHRRFRKVLTKFKQIQSDASIFCGFYCLGFLLAMTQGLTIPSFFKKFNMTHLGENDTHIIKFIQENV